MRENGEYIKHLA